MKKLISVLSLLLVASMLFSIAMADEMSLEDMQKHTPANLTCLADYNVLFDDNTYSALFYSKDMIGTYMGEDWSGVVWETYDPAAELPRVLIDQLYLGFEVFASYGDLTIVPCLVSSSPLELYFKAGNSRYSAFSTEGEINTYNKSYDIPESIWNVYTYRLSLTGYNMLKLLAESDNASVLDVSVSEEFQERITLTAEDQQTIADFVADIKSIGLGQLAFPDNTFFTCYTNWE